MEVEQPVAYTEEPQELAEAIHEDSCPTSEPANRAAIQVELIDAERSVQCIHALEQVMAHFQEHGGMAFDGDDMKVVRCWFAARYGLSGN